MCSDIFSTERRSQIMSGIRGRDTKPELIVRSICHSLGLRFRLYRSDLPGKPDLVFPKHKVCLFVNGCFWHRHQGCRYAYTPKTRVDFWLDKFSKNVERDQINQKRLVSLGWKVLVVWECELKDRESLALKLSRIAC